VVAAIRERRIGVGETVIGKAAAERTPIQIPDVLADPELCGILGDEAIRRRGLPALR